MADKGTKIFIIILVLIIILAGGYVAFRIFYDKKANEEETPSVAVMEAEEPEKENKIKIYQGQERAIAVMIDNHTGAWPQAGLNKAYMVYEIVVEGGETRLMAVFKGQDLEKIGPVRSSRHYFLDYAMENDAIYAHFGWSPQAESDIAQYGINNINGISESEEIFWRVKDKSAPHNAVTSTQQLLKSAQAKKYRTTSNKKSVLNYVSEEVELTEGQEATEVTIPHSTLQTVKYEYDQENKVYKRYARKKAQTDWETGDAITTKNIIVTFCDNSSIQNDEKGRQDLSNIGTFDGYYITNGKAIKIKCTKQARDKQTVYKDLDGKEIEVNDGNTFVNICPKSAKVVIE